MHIGQAAQAAGATAKMNRHQEQSGLAPPAADVVGLPTAHRPGAPSQTTRSAGGSGSASHADLMARARRGHAPA